MNHCPESARLQDFLEALLPDPEMRALTLHVTGCARCIAERARLERLFEALDEMPLEFAPPALAERVLDRVLPSRQRARWARRLGFGYAGALVASLGGMAVVVMHPASRSFLAWLVGAAPARVVDSLKFMVNVTSFVALRLASGWGLVSSAESKVSPMMRALLAAMDQPAFQLCLMLAAASCLAVLWWLRPRAGRGQRGMPHVGLLGF